MPNQKKRPACGFKREVGREDTGRYLTDSALQDLSLSSSMAGSLSVASYSTLPSPYSGPCLTCWTARQPRHSPPSARPPVLPIRDSKGGDRHHDFALALYCHGAHVPVWWAAEAIDGQLQEHISRVGVQISQTFQVSTYLQLMPWCSPATTYLQLLPRNSQASSTIRCPSGTTLFLHYVPLLSYQATNCVPHDFAPHLRSVLHLSLQATDVALVCQNAEMIPAQEKRADPRTRGRAELRLRAVRVHGGEGPHLPARDGAGVA